MDIDFKNTYFLPDSMYYPKERRFLLFSSWLFNPAPVKNIVWNINITIITPMARLTMVSYSISS